MTSVYMFFILTLLVWSASSSQVDQNCSSAQRFRVHTNLSNFQFCLDYRFYHAQLCESMQHFDAHCPCNIVSFGHTACFDNVCICIHDEPHIYNVTLEYELAHAIQNFYGPFPSWVQSITLLRKEMDLSLVLGTVMMVLMLLVFGVLFYKLYKRYVGYEKVVVVLASEQKGARTHDSVCEGHCAAHS
jgi:hypothetical protein